jgi:hypothetical protein
VRVGVHTHRWSRRAVRHADRSNRIGGSGRSRHLSCRCGNAESKARPADACGAGLAASKGRGRRAWPYAWKDGKPVKAAAKPSQNTEMTDRLILPMVNACVACLREGVVEDGDGVGDRLRAVSRRSFALCAIAWHRKCHLCPARTHQEVRRTIRTGCRLGSVAPKAMTEAPQWFGDADACGGCPSRGWDHHCSCPAP